MNKSIIMVDNFYDNPDEVREYAFGCDYYQPYYLSSAAEQREKGHINYPTWNTSVPSQRYITRENVSKLEELVDAKIDMNHFKSYDWEEERGTKWNAAFHFKTEPESYMMEKGIHNHVYDSWNRCGAYGWAGVVFLTPNDRSIPHNGLDIHQHKYGMTWDNVDEYRNGKFAYDVNGHVMDYVDLDNHIQGNPLATEAHNKEWDLKARFKFNYNTLILHRSTEYHSSAPGWGSNFDNCRMIQTFFFKTI